MAKLDKVSDAFGINANGSLKQLTSAFIATGTPVTGNVPVYQADGSVAWTTPLSVSSFAKTGGTARTGAISLTQGANVTITDNTDGSFTIASSGSGGGGGTSWTSPANIAVGDIVFASSPNGVVVAPGSTVVFDGSDIAFRDISEMPMVVNINTFGVNFYRVLNSYLFVGSTNSGSGTMLITLNGVDWRQPLTVGSATDATFFSNNYYAISGQFIYQTTDFLNFTQVYNAGASNFQSQGIASTTTNIVASLVDTSTSAWRVVNSSNGTAWNTALSGTGGNRYFFAVNGNNVLGVPTNTATNVVYSTNGGSTINTGAGANTSNFPPIVFNNTFCWSNGTQFIYTDIGVTVNNINLTNSFSANTVKLISGQNEVLIFSSNSSSNIVTRITNINGITTVPTQSSVTISALSNIINIINVNNVYYLFGLTSASMPMVYTSSDGSTWTFKANLNIAFSNAYYKAPFFFWSQSLATNLVLSYSSISNQLQIANSEANVYTPAPIGTYRHLGNVNFAENGLWVRTA